MGKLSGDGCSLDCGVNAIVLQKQLRSYGNPPGSVELISARTLYLISGRFFFFLFLSFFPSFFNIPRMPISFI